VPGILARQAVVRAAGEERWCSSTAFVDNKSTIQLSKNPVYHDRDRHIEVRYDFICESIEQGKIDIEYIKIKDQLANSGGAACYM
jgi:hypothetical protein